MTGQPKAVELGILGPLEVRVAGRPFPVAGARQRALLAALALRRGHTVPMDLLVDEVFGEARHVRPATPSDLRHSAAPGPRPAEATGALEAIAAREPWRELAATLHEAAPSRSYGVEAARVATALAAVRRRLGDAAYARAWTAGAARTLEEAADDAMRLLEPGPADEHSNTER